MAYKPLRDTSRCHLFEQIADKVWGWVTDAHDVQWDENEPGITRKIIIEILKHRNLIRDNFDVFIKPSWREQNFGSDMDVFVEVSPGIYRWFALQAKLLKLNKRYDTFHDGSTEVRQWQKLARLEQKGRCKAFYLLYNGAAGADLKELEDCAGDFLVSQYGCSLVEPVEVARLATKRNAADTRNVNPTFEDFHPELAFPWRMLTCCSHKTDATVLYPLSEIEKANYSFIDISELTEVVDVEEARPFIQFIQPGSIRSGEIDEAAEEAGWNPTVRIVINQTQSL